MNDCENKDLYRLYIVQYALEKQDKKGVAVVVGVYPSDVVQTFLSRSKWSAYKDDIKIETITSIPNNLSEGVLAEINI